MVSKKDLRKYAELLMFSMKEEEYDVLKQEFEIILEQLNKIEKIDGLNNYEPMVFPFDNNDLKLREDEIGMMLKNEEVLKNASEGLYEQIKIAKVVE